MARVDLPTERYASAAAPGGQAVAYTASFLLTSGFRLHVLDGRGVTIENLAVPPMPSFRLVWESSVRMTSVRIPGFLPRDFPSTIKLFEVVTGARVQGRCAPGGRVRLAVPVKTNTGRRFDWTAEAQCARWGHYVLRSPYASPRAILSAGNLQAQVAITDVQVRAGKVVEADLGKAPVRKR
ncbi:MAG: hypothetical protein A2Y95_11080 [Deltaproteobacteria bacterium RBG_13_65_10]|nr:MAG: hypothetical protein A2Y95_11080 [Deltaproteobacteria bacterium RBG_13_65_10]